MTRSRRPWTPRDVASLSLGLFVSSAGVVISDMVALWTGYLQPVIVVAVTLIFGFSMRVAYDRAEQHTGRMWLAGLAVLMSAVGSAVGFAFLGGLAFLIDGNGSFTNVVEFGIIGGIIGFCVGVPLLPFVIALGALARRPLVDAIDRVLVTGASMVMVSSLFAIALQGERDASYGGYIILGCATAMFIVAGLKARTRGRWLGAVLGGEVPNWSVIDRFDGDEQLPAIGVQLAEPGVLATGNFSGGPFRAGGAVSPVARVDRAGGYTRLPTVAFALAALTLIASLVALWRRAAVHEHMAFDASFDKPTRFKNLGPMDDLAVGSRIVCAHRADGTVKCWGSNMGWVLKLGEPLTFRTPTLVPPLQGSKLFVAHDRACTLQSGKAVCFESLPSTPMGSANVRQVAFNNRDVRFHLLADGTVLELTARPGVEPRQLHVPKATMIAASNDLVCVLAEPNAVYCEGQSNRATATMDTDMTQVQGIGEGTVDWIGVRASDAWARVTTPDGKHHFYSWIGREASEASVWTAAGVEEISLDEYETCGRRADGSVLCDTDRPVGELKRLREPREMLPPGSAIQLIGGDGATCARGKTDVWCWGDL